MLLCYFKKLLRTQKLSVLDQITCVPKINVEYDRSIVEFVPKSTECYRHVNLILCQSWRKEYDRSKHQKKAAFKQTQENRNGNNRNTLPSFSVEGSNEASQLACPLLSISAGLL